ncbi:MAG: AraC family transcriptional regulator [Treponema sp.]|nr:AraC family transcriptional regulator [Candidatus Treponema equifaecale]
MTHAIYDTKRNGLYRDKVQDFFVDRLVRTESMAESHYHPYYELFYVVKGTCRMFVGHSLFILSQGELVILPPSTLHRTQYEDKVERITLSFTETYLENIKSILGKDFFKTNVQMGKMTFNSNSRVKLEENFDELLYESRKNDEFSEINRKSCLLKLLIQIARNSDGRNEREQLIGETEASIQKAARFIFENYEKDISLEQAAQIAGMRDTYFSRKFQEVTGYGFKEYLTNIRLQHSQEMLLNGQLTITQIALACGFTNSNYFGDAFKKHTGQSPREFRKQQTD